MKNMIHEYFRRYNLLKGIEDYRVDLELEPVHEGESDSIDLYNARLRAQECEDCVTRLYLGIKEDILWEIMDMDRRKKLEVFGLDFEPTIDLINIAFSHFESEVSYSGQIYECFVKCMKRAVHWSSIYER